LGLDDKATDVSGALDDLQAQRMAGTEPGEPANKGARVAAVGPNQPPLQVATDLGRVTRGSGPLDQDAPGVGVPRLGDAPLTAGLSTGVFTGDQPQGAHELAGGGRATEVPQFRNQSDGGQELHAPQRLERLDYWHPAPGLDQGWLLGFE